MLLDNLDAFNTIITSLEYETLLGGVNKALGAINLFLHSFLALLLENHIFSWPRWNFELFIDPDVQTRCKRHQNDCINIHYNHVDTFNILKDLLEGKLQLKQCWRRRHYLYLFICLF